MTSTATRSTAERASLWPVLDLRKSVSAASAEEVGHQRADTLVAPHAQAHDPVQVRGRRPGDRGAPGRPSAGKGR